jgi:hypothetical protein
MLQAIRRVIRERYEMRAKDSFIEPFAFNRKKDPW